MSEAVAAGGGGVVHSALRMMTGGVTEAEVRAALAGNLCRCTGYQSIVAAVLRAAQEGVGREA